jgi:tartrate dehydratase beta subunit/fumarate hydratase class I family protein
MMHIVSKGDKREEAIEAMKHHPSPYMVGSWKKSTIAQKRTKRVYHALFKQAFEAMGPMKVYRRSGQFG